MPSPFGAGRSANAYYNYGGEPHSYAYDWTGVPPPTARSAESRALAGDYLDISASFHKELGDDIPTYPVSLTAETGGQSILHAGPEQTPLYDAAVPPAALGFFGALSRNEKRALLLGGVALAGWFAWTFFLKGKKR